MLGVIVVGVLSCVIFNHDSFITQTWYQGSQLLTERRHYAVRLPIEPSESYVAVILLHAGMVTNWVRAVDDMPIMDGVALIHPQGYLGQWNVTTEDTRAPDVEFLDEIIDRILQFDDVTQIIVAGMSNGAAMVNRFMIETQSPYVVAGIACISQLVTNMYNGTHFFKGGKDNAYDTVAIPMQRSMTTIVGSRDTIAMNEFSFPHNDVFWGPGGPLISAQDSALAWARTYGYTESKLPLLVVNNNNPFNVIQKVEYPNSRLYVTNQGHGCHPAIMWEAIRSIM